MRRRDPISQTTMPAYRPAPFGIAVLLALGLTLLNAAKPLTVDDPLYYGYAVHFADQPLDPYGFSYEWPVPAFDMLAPPVLPYWLSVAVGLFPDSIALWKLSLLPFSLLFAGSLAALFRRWAPGLEAPLLLVTVMSPTFLPSLNLMLDIPALGLSLAALVVFMRAVQRGSWWGAICAGLLAGVASQTKYNGLLSVGVCVAYAGLWRQWRLGVCAAATAIALFAGWEGLMSLRYGESYFLHHMGSGSPALAGVGRLSVTRVATMMTQLGGASAPLTVLGLAAIGLSRRWLIVAAVVVALVYGALLTPVAGWAVLWLRPLTPWSVQVADVCFGVLGVIFTAIVAMIAFDAVRRGRPDAAPAVQQNTVNAGDDWFLFVWLMIELAGYFPLTSFPAARRIMRIMVPATIVIGRLAARAPQRTERRRTAWAIAAAGAALGLVYFAVDYREAAAMRTAVDAVARRTAGSDTTVWYTGSWGFKFYAERAGMRLVAPGMSRLKRGDWLAVPDRVPRRPISLDHAPVVVAGPAVEVGDGLPLETLWGYYCGLSPLAPHRGPRLTITLYRVTDDFVIAP